MAKSANYICTPLAVPQHSVMAAMVVLGVEVANDKDSKWDADHCQHKKGKDGHATLPGSYDEPDSPVFPNTLSYRKNLLLSVIHVHEMYPGTSLHISGKR